MGPRRAKNGGFPCVLAWHISCHICSVRPLSDNLRPRPTPIFIGGVPRSGTTLLRMIVDSHSALACGPEMRLIPQICEMYRAAKQAARDAPGAAWELEGEHVRRGFAEMITDLLEPARLLSGKARIAEKTPANGAWFAELRELFPDAPQIHVIRDGRDVVASLLGLDWRDGRTGEPFDFVRSARAAAAMWARQIGIARDAFATPEANGRVFELRYEAMIERPRETLEPLFALLGEPWEEQVLDFHLNPRAGAGENETSAAQVSRPLYRESVGRWRRDLTPVQLAEVMDEAGETLAALGYFNERASA